MTRWLLTHALHFQWWNHVFYSKTACWTKVHLKHSSMRFFIQFMFLIDFKVICYVCDKGRVLVLCCPDGSEQLDAPPKGSEPDCSANADTKPGGGRVKVCLRSFGFTKTSVVQKNIGQSIWLNSRGSISNCRSSMRRYLSLRGGWEQMWSILSMFYITHSKSSR